MAISPRFPLHLLVDLPNWVGDQVMTLPAVAGLIRANRGGNSVIHSRPPTRRLFELLFPDAIVVASPPKTSPFRAAWRVASATGRADFGVTLRNAWRAKIFLRCVARCAWGSRGGGGWILDRSFVIETRAHQSHDHDSMLSALGVKLEGTAEPWSLPTSLLAEGREILVGQGSSGSRHRIGLAPAAASGISKQWPPQRFGELARRLMAEGEEPLLVIGPGEEGLAGTVQEAAGKELAVVGSNVDVAGLAGILSALDLVVCNDSGPMHLAGIFGTRVVAVFGPTDPRRTSPLGSHHTIVRRDIDCMPCRRSVCPFGHGDCLGSLDVERVLDAVHRQCDQL